MSIRSAALGAVAVTAIVVLSGCSSSSGSPATSATSSAASSAAGGSATTVVSSSSAAPASTLFGPGCATLGLTASNTALAAQVPVGTVAATVPFLSSVVAATSAGGLTATFNAAPALTVFAPVNDAFKKEPPAQVQSLLTDPKMKPLLIKTLKYAVLGSEVGRSALAGTHKTLEGTNLTITGSGENFVVNGKAKILCGGIKAKNAVVYVIDTVLHPAS